MANKINPALQDRANALTSKYTEILGKVAERFNGEILTKGDYVVEKVRSICNELGEPMQVEICTPASRYYVAHILIAEVELGMRGKGAYKLSVYISSASLNPFAYVCPLAK